MFPRHVSIHQSKIASEDYSTSDNITISLTHSSWHVCVDVASRTIHLNTSLFWASLPASVGLIGRTSLMSSVHLLVGRPFLHLPSSLAFNVCFSRVLCLFRWPKYESIIPIYNFEIRVTFFQ